MTDYHPLIARAVEGLDKSSGEARRALYERARTALVTQLRAVEPPLSESEITKERLALEDAIRKVEADAARKSRAELQEPRPAAPPRREATRLEPKRSEPAAPKQNPRRTGGSRSAATGSAANGARAAAGCAIANIVEPRRRQGLPRRCQRGERSGRRDSQGRAVGARHARFVRAGGFTTSSDGGSHDGLQRLRSGRRRRGFERRALRSAALARPRAILRSRRRSGGTTSGAATAARGRPRASVAAAASLVPRAGPARCGAGHPRRLAGDDILAVAAHQQRLSLHRPDRIQTAEPDDPRYDFAAEILRTGSAGAKHSGARRGRAGEPDGAGGGTARRALRGGFERSAGQALCRLRYLADRDGIAGERPCAGTGGTRGRDNSRTPDRDDVVAAPQYRQGAAGQPHRRDHVQSAGGLFQAAASPMFPAS